MTTTLVLALFLAGAPPATRTWSVDRTRSVVRYHVVHRFHSVTGVSSTIEGKGVVEEGGRMLAMVRVPISSFDSGERNRDANMNEAVDSRRFPFVVFKGVARLDGVALPASRPTTLETRMDGEVELHGVKRPVVVPLTVDLSPDGTGRARGAFVVSLDAFGIERPSLLFVKIDDGCRIEIDLALREERP
jgi:polyisoprenoid-binding protein YceI